MADNETIADIIAEMRGMGNYQRYSGDHARVLANRLEAAHRRERGDAAKLREALENAYSLLCEGIATEVDDAIEHPFHLELACEKIQVALAAPPRNCDCFKTAAEAIDAYQDLTGDQLATDSGMKEWVEFAVWLFAPATEKEGGVE